MENIIPEVTNQMGKYFNQPDRSEILIDDDFAIMTGGTFEKLLDYTFSRPSGVYDGKMWKTRGAAYWWLGWYYSSDDPKMCSTEYRKILIA